jgi:hypothetical protein
VKDILGREFAVIEDKDGHIAFVGPKVTTLWFSKEEASKVALDIANLIGGIDTE